MVPTRASIPGEMLLLILVPLAHTLKLFTVLFKRITQVLFKMLPLGWSSEWESLCMGPLRVKAHFPMILLSLLDVCPLLINDWCVVSSSWSMPPGLGHLLRCSDPLLLRGDHRSHDIPPACHLHIGVKVLTRSCLYLSYSYQYGFFFISLTVEILFSWSSGHFQW